jgi:tetratricopeptide (TPR) repeat protein
MRPAAVSLLLVLACAGQDSRGLSVSDTPKRKALVIGNQNYRERPLAKVSNDAEDIAASLRRLGFAVDLAKDLSRSEMESRASRFASNLRSGDIAWFYYAGHGYQMNGENYLVPVDFRASTAVEARSAGFPFSKIKSALEGSPAQLTIMVLDACRNNPFADGPPGTQGMALLEAGLGAYIAFAASPGHTALEYPDQRNGLFTGRLIEALSRPGKISDLFRQVRQQVYAASNHNQLPYIHDQMIADLYLRGEPTAPAEQAGSSDALFEEGKTLYYGHQCREALEKLDRVARANPGNAYVQNALGLTYLCLNLSSRAVEHFSRAIDIQPGYAAAYWNRGQVFAANGQFELAIEDFDWALEREPENGSLYWRRGLAKLGLRHYEDAAKDFTKSIAADSSSPYGYHGRARVNYELGKYREALADVDAAVARKQDYADAMELRARVRERLADGR